MSTLRFNTWQDISGNTFSTIKQVVSKTSSVTQGSTSTTYAEYTPVALSITPTSANSKLLILFWSQIYHHHYTGIHFSIRKNETSLIGDDTISYFFGTDGTGDSDNAYKMMPVYFQYLDSPNSSSIQNFTLFARSDVGGYQTWINRPANQTYTSRSNVTGSTTLTVMEIAQ